jgi:shikimate kinase
MNIILTGFASSGKTTAAEALCGMAGLRHVDLDRVVEERYERRHGVRASCRVIFGDVGAEGFSALENDAIRSLSNLRNAVLSTGGRTPMNEENRALLKSFGSVVYLRCGTGTVLTRMKDKGAPVSMGRSQEEIAKEWNLRDPVYSAFADVVIDNGALTPEDTAREILKALPAVSEGGDAACQAHSGTI